MKSLASAWHLVQIALLIMDTEYILCTTPTIWQRDLSKDNFIYSGNVTFIEQTTHQGTCALACYRRGIALCRYFSYTVTSHECRGYTELTAPTSQPNTYVLEGKRCGAVGYTYEPILQSCLRLSTDTQDWSSASSICIGEGAHLVYLETQAKMNVVFAGVHKEALAMTNSWWVGAYDNGHPKYKWLNGVDVDGSLFHPGEPNSAKEDCLNLYSQHGNLNDLTCTARVNYICEVDIM